MVTAEPNIDYKKRCEILKRQLDSLEQELKEAKRVNKRLRLLCRKNGIKIEGLEEEEPLFNSITKGLDLPLKVGQITYLDVDSGNFTQRIWVKQIIDKNNMLAKLTLKTVPKHRSYRGERATVVTKAGYTSIDEIVWIRGIDTSNWVDGNEIKIFAPLKVVGTKTYETVEEGTKTVFFLEPYITSRSD